MYRSKLQNLQILILWFIVDSLVSVAYALMVKAKKLESGENIQERRNGK